jgi:hypothetical protein
VGEDDEQLVAHPGLMDDRVVDRDVLGAVGPELSLQPVILVDVYTAVGAAVVADGVESDVLDQVAVTRRYRVVRAAVGSLVSRVMTPRLSYTSAALPLKW